MKRKFIAMSLAITVSMASVALADTNVSAAITLNAEASSQGDEKFVDGSDQVIQEGGFPSKAAVSDDGIMPLAEDATTKQVQEKLMDAWDNVLDRCDLSDFHITEDELGEIYWGTLNHYPQYFFVKSAYSYSYNSSGEILSVNITYAVNKEEIPAMSKNYKDAVAKIMSNVDASWSQMEKALYINDYLALNCAYDLEALNAGSNGPTLKPNSFNAYGVLVGKSAVCQGYALAFMELAQQMGLNCQMVSSASLNHAWNLVEINGKYYNVDVTWNDPTNDRIGRACHKYLMKSTSYFESENGGHKKEDDWVVSGGVSKTEASDTAYDDYFWNSIDTGFDYIDGFWYGFDGTDSICKYSCNGTNFAKDKALVEINDIWYVTGGNGSFYTIKFVGTGAYNGKLYYSGPDTIYELDVATEKSTSVFKLSDAEKNNGSIYGLYVSPSGEIQYIFSEKIGSNEKIFTISAGYNISFDGNGAEEGSMDNMLLYTPGAGYTLPSNQYSKQGYTFKGWNTKPDGTGVAYADQGAFSYEAGGSATLTLYAQWEEKASECEHVPEIRGQKEATCTEEGYTGDTYCKTCGELISKGETIAKLEHTEVIVEAVAPTCTEPGKTEGSHCSVCNTVIKAQEEIPATGHSWDDHYTVDKEPTTEEAGLESIHCKNCDETKDAREIPKLEEGQEPYQVLFDGNGAESGSMESLKLYTAGEEYALPENQFSRPGYTFKGWNTEPDGTGIAYADQGAFSYEADGSTMLTLYAQWAQEASECQHIPEIRGQKEATCTEEGYTGDTYCKTCGELLSKGETIAKLEHTEVIDEAVAATCTEPGKTEGSHCSVCGTVIKAQEEIPATGHSWDDKYTVDKEPTTEEAGLESIHCKNCDATKDEREIPKLEEGQEPYQVLFDGNGAESGSMDSLKLYTEGEKYALPENQYSRTGYTFKGWNTEPDGTGVAYADQGAVSYEAGDSATLTLYAQWEEKASECEHDPEIRGQKEATCTEEGYTGDTYCKTCGELLSKGETIAKLEHTEVIDKAVAPTCTEEGKTEGSHCSVCNTVIKAQEKIAATGHSWDNRYTVDKAATTREEGKRSIHCKNCDATKDEQVIPKLSTGGSSSGSSGGYVPTYVPTYVSGNNNSGGSAQDTPTDNTDTSNQTTDPTKPQVNPSDPTTPSVEPAKPDEPKVTQTTNKYGNVVQETEQEQKDDAGNVIGTSIKSEILTGLTDSVSSITVNVGKDVNGAVTNTSAKIVAQLPAVTQRSVFRGKVISQIVEAAGTDDIDVKLRVENKNGSFAYSVTAKASDLTAGNKLYLVAKNAVGDSVLVNAKTYTVTKNGTVSVSAKSGKSYEFITASRMNSLSKQILNTIQAKNTSKTIQKSKTVQMAFKNTLNMDNVKSVVYSVSDKSVATVTKKGVVKGKKSGTAVVKAKVTLKNGQSKTVKMKVTVK